MNKRRLLCLSALVIAILVFTARYVMKQSTMGSRIPVNKKLITANTDFAFRLFKDTAANNPGRNILIFPCGASMTLTLAYNGALDDTKKAMGKALALDKMSEPEINESNSALMDNLNNPGSGIELNVANAAWLDKKVQIVPKFIDTARKYYDAEAANIDLANSGSIINDWVSKKTRGRIDNIAEGLDASSVLCLTNAVYFKGTWTNPFDKKSTSSKPFILTDSSMKQVPMMYQEDDFRCYNCEYNDNVDFKAIALPYGSGRMSMYVFLPGKYSSLKTFLQTLNEKNWNMWLSHFEKKKLEVYLPRWKFDSQMNLIKPCKRLGMGVAFDPCKSNFQRMCKCDDRNNVYVSVLKQKVFIEVDEEGTEAIAGTYFLSPVSAVYPSFFANRPFFYAIRDDRTGEILFMGIVEDPTLEKAEAQ